LPEDLHGKKVVIVSVCWAGTLGEGEEVVRPLRSLGSPPADLLGPIPYVALQQLVDPLYQPGAANYFTSDSMARFGAGQIYVNFTGERDEDKVRASYPAETYARLAAVKARYDPANRFRFNQNIRPAQAR
jgi:hypothetical protein